MATELKVLGQLVPTTAGTPETIYTVPSGKEASGRIVATANAGGNINVTVFLDPTGTPTYDTSTMLTRDVAVGNQDPPFEIDFKLQDGGTIGVDGSPDGKVSFTVHGLEVDSAP